MIKVFKLSVSGWSLILMLGDFVVFSLAVILYVILWDPSFYNIFIKDSYGIILIIIFIIYALVLYIFNFYDYYVDYRHREAISRLLLSSLFGVFANIILLYYIFGPFVKRQFLEWHGLFFVWLLLLWRYLFSTIALPKRLCRNLLIVGATDAGADIVRTIQQSPNCGFRVIGFVDDEPQKIGTIFHGFPILGGYSDISQLVRQNNIGIIVSAVTEDKLYKILNDISYMSFVGVQVVDMPLLYEFLTGKVPIDHISDPWIMYNNIIQQNRFYINIKRVIDIVAGCMLLLLALPLFIIIPIAIKIDSEGPVIYRQKRLGFRGKPFYILKFRTMFDKSDRKELKWTIKNDSRITNVGYYLRKYRIDEIPQLINVIKGEMSLIGPRAEWNIFAENCRKKTYLLRPGRRSSDPPGTMIKLYYKEAIPYYSIRLSVRPGITGWAQVMYPHAGSSMEELKEKLQYDLYYIKNIGLFIDIIIILKTINIIMFGKGK